MSNDKTPADTATPANEAKNSPAADAAPAIEKPPLSPAAKRALAEAEERRRLREAQTIEQEKEIGGRGGADPARFGDWEIDGRAIDF